MIKQYFRYLRNAAVQSYENAILECIETVDVPVSVLDCGCDNGEWTLRLGTKAGRAKLFGIEIIEQSVFKARDKGVRCICSDLNRQFPFQDKSMDIIHANQVIEHLHDTDMFVREIKRLLKPGGYAVICTENLSSWHNIISLMCGWQPFSLTNVSETKFQIGNPLAIHNQKPTENPNSWQHMRVFSYRGLKELFEEYDFEVERYLGSGYYPLPAWAGRVDPRHAAFLTIKVRKS